MEKVLDKVLMQKQIAAAVLSQDQLCFVYVKPDSNEVVVRFVTPIELDAENVLCAQHLPEEGYRKFKLDNIRKFHRVISRDVFANSTFFSKPQTASPSSAATSPAPTPVAAPVPTPVVP